MTIYQNEEIKEKLFLGRFGLELESHRVTPDAHMSRTLHPFPGNPNIVRDFSEDHVEINTDPQDSPEAAVQELKDYIALVQRTIADFEKPECLWFSSNPPKIRDEADIVFARYPQEERWNTVYRDSLSNRYGRYVMTYAGIHFNYSFDEELLQRIWKARGGEGSYRQFHDRFYLDLAEQAAYYAWLVVVLTAASPVMDSSFFEQGIYGNTMFTGFASPRCSEIGYWNLFSPVFDYTDTQKYADKIQSYADIHVLDVGRELYYPIRLKPPGPYTIEGLKEEGISHIELRMIDINPFADTGIDTRDVRFLQYLMIWLSSLQPLHLTERQQIQATQNCKRAARYDIDLAKVCLRTDQDTHQPDYIYGKPGWPKITDDEIAKPVRRAALDVLWEMRRFFEVLTEEAHKAGQVLETIDYQISKLTVSGVRYAERVRKAFGTDYLKQVLGHSGQIQRRYLEGQRRTGPVL